MAQQSTAEVRKPDGTVVAAPVPEDTKLRSARPDKDGKIKALNAEKRSKFFDIADKRLVKAVAAIRSLESLGSSAYDHSEADHSAIENALKGAVVSVLNKLKGTRTTKAGSILSA